MFVKVGGCAQVTLLKYPVSMITEMLVLKYVCLLAAAALRMGERAGQSIDENVNDRTMSFSIRKIVPGSRYG